jgi:hypothetical protein
MDAGQGPLGAGNPYSPPRAAIDGEELRPAQSIEVAGFKSVRGLAKAISIVLVVEAVVELAVAASCFVTISVLQRVVAGETVERSQLLAMGVRTGALSGLGALLSLTAIVLFCLFMPRANRNARSFGAPLSNSPGWSAGWFFVPVAFWWKPYYAMKEIWQGSDPDPAVPAFQAKVSALLPWWWWMFVLRTIGGMVTNQVNGAKPSDVLMATQIQVVWFVPSIAAAILAGAVVRALARRQDERQRRELARTAAPVTASAAP